MTMDFYEQKRSNYNSKLTQDLPCRMKKANDIVTMAVVVVAIVIVLRQCRGTMSANGQKFA